MTVLRMTDLDLRGKRVLIREDLNVPVQDGVVTSDARIRASLPTIQAAKKAGARVLVMSHLGRPEEAADVLRPITAGLDVIENTEYHQLLRMYRGERTPEELLATAGDDSGGSATRYGVSAWLLVNGRRGEAESLWKSILEGTDWPSFGHLAAEAEMARAVKDAR